EVRRFRPNIVVEATETVCAFVENNWLKRGLRIGTVTLRVTIPMSRCVMTTLPQMDLPRDLGILRTAAVHNRLQIQTWGQFACVGVCGLVRSSGAVRRGDTVALVDCERGLDGGAQRVRRRSTRQTREARASL